MELDLTSSRFLVTGARGQLGLHVVKELAVRGTGRVHALDAKPAVGATWTGSISGCVDEVVGDLRDGDLLRDLASRCDVIIHLGAVLSQSTKADPRASFDVNVGATHRLLSLAAEFGAKKFVFGSSVNVHGDYRTPDAVIRESDALRSRNMYAASKIAGEAFGYAFSEMGGAPFVALRFGVIYGPEQHDYGLIPSLVVKALHDIEREGAATVHADPDSTVDLLYVKDAAEATLRAAVLPVANVSINVVTGRPTTIRHLLERALTLAGKQESLASLRWEIPLGQPRRHMIFDPQKILDELGFIPATNVAFGIGEYLAWRREKAS